MLYAVCGALFQMPFVYKTFITMCQNGAWSPIFIFFYSDLYLTNPETEREKKLPQNHIVTVSIFTL